MRPSWTSPCPGFRGSRSRANSAGCTAARSGSWAYTGWGTTSDRDRCLDAGFDGFIVKPADPQHLLQVLGKATGELVQRSIDARVRQLHRQIELGHTLLAHGEGRQEALEPICAFLDRAFEACRMSLPGLPIADDERQRLSSELAVLSARIAKIRTASRPPPRDLDSTSKPAP